jgi:hypothetical protein
MQFTRFVQRSFAVKTVFQFTWIMMLLAGLSWAQDPATPPAEQPPAEEAKPQDPKPEEAKPAEAKPEEAKPQDPKPEEPKPEEPKPEETKPAPETPAKAESPNGPKVSVVVEGLDNPCGVAVQPGTGIVYVADSAALRIVKIVDGKAEPVITDFTVDIYGKGPQYNIGPLGLAFLDENTLVVGGGGKPDGEDQLFVFNLKDAQLPLKAEQAKSAFPLTAAGELKGEGNFYALGITNDGIYVTCNGDDTKGWISKATRNGVEVSGFERYLATKEAVEVDAPVGITVSPRGELVVGQGGEVNVGNDSLLSFYDPASKKLLLNLKTELHDITGLAYSPRGQLYAIDFAWLDTTQGGLFQMLKDETKGIRTKKILPLDKPTAMAFGPDGSLYVTIVAGEKNGKLIKIDPGL